MRGLNAVVKKEAKPEAKKAKANDEANADSFSVGSFLQGTKEEFGKVVWPSRQQLISESAAVILMVSLSATLIYLIDKFFGLVSRQVF